MKIKFHKEFSTPLPFVYGPVKSRRLGVSLGINVFSKKTCNFNCVYCEMGHTVGMNNGFFKCEHIITAVKRFFQNSDIQLDSITLSGNGEPTLHPQIEKIIERVKELRDFYFPDVPVTILTNSSSMELKVLEKVDRVIAKLDVADQQSFEAINRPLIPTKVTDIIESLIKARKRLKDKLIIQTMLLKSKNFPSKESLELLKQAINRINPSFLMLYTIDRKPIESFAEPISLKDLQSFASNFDRIKVQIYPNRMDDFCNDVSRC